MSAPEGASNNGMHPTAGTTALIFGGLLGRRVMPGVRPWLLRDKKYFMEGLNVTRLKDFAPYALPATRWRLISGVLLQIFAVAVPTLGLYYIGFVIKPKSIDHNVIRVVLLLAIGIFVFIFITGKQLRTDTRKHLLDARAPILYLRPFGHERSELSSEPNEVFSYRYQDNPLSPVLKLFLNVALPGGWPNNSVSTTDDLIARALNEIGPVVAVGIPHETLPPSGALRLYFRDEEWQEKVKELMSISKMVIIQPGYSPNLDWEMDTARQNFPPEQIYISFLDWADLQRESRGLQFELFNLQLKRIFGIALPQHFINAHLIYFDNDWQPFKVTLDRRMKILLFPRFNLLTTPLLREMLRPVLQKRKMKLSLWRTVAYEIVVKFISGILFFGYLYLCFHFDK